MANPSVSGSVSDDPVVIYSTASDSRFIDKRYANLKSDVLEITHDKLENILLKFYQRHSLRTAWFNPLSLAAGLALTLSTADFKPSALGVDGPTWKAMFVLGLIASLGWFIYMIGKLMVCWKETSIESLIDRIKNRSEEA